jgi:hypothetical protein
MSRALLVNAIEGLPTRRHRRHVWRDVTIVAVLLLAVAAFVQTVR